MRRFLITTTLAILAVGIGWRYAPPQARERLLGFAGMANRADPARVAQGIREKIAPEDPAARRSALTTALKEKIREIKNNAAGGNNPDQSGAPAGAPHMSAASVGRAADEAAIFVSQLEQANQDASVGGQIAQRVLDAILPAAQCKAP